MRVKRNSIAGEGHCTVAREGQSKGADAGGDEAGQVRCDNQSNGARPSQQFGEGPLCAAREGQYRRADADELDGEGQGSRAPKGQRLTANSVELTPDIVASIVEAIRGSHRRRCFAMEQRKRADLALGSFLRSALGWSRSLPDAERKAINDRAQDLIELGEKEAKGKPVDLDEPAWIEWRDVIAAAIMARAPFDAIERDATKRMEKLARALPVWSAWAEHVRGFGAISLAVIVAETGDIAHYATPAKLWKRCGLAVMDGVRQGGLAKSAGANAWIAHGYNRQRRSRIFVIGDCLVKGNGDGPYRKAYLERKAYERARAEAAGLIVAPAAKIPAKRKAAFMSDGHVHRRAQRYLEKRLLKDLWRAWRRASVGVSPALDMPAADLSRESKA